MSDRSGGADAPRAIRLRPYQLSAVARIEATVAAGVRRLVLVLPTGGGKTTIAGSLVLRAVERGQRVLFLAHRRELIVQAYQRLLEMGLSVEQVGIVMASDRRRRPGASVQVASIDTLRRRARPLADVVFVDECHRALAASYREIATDYPDAIHLGLTATPYRADGKGLGDAYVRPDRFDSSRYHGLNLNSLFFRGTFEFRYFNGTLHAGEVKAYVQLVLAIAAKGLTSKAASSKRREFNVATAKYDFRVFLLNLGLIGDEYKTARQHLTKRLAGSAAWKGERRDRRVRPAPNGDGGNDERTVGACAA